MDFYNHQELLPGDGVSRARSATRASRRDLSIDIASGCALPSTRRAVGAVSSSIVTALRRSSSVSIQRYEKAKSLTRRQIPVARRVLGEGCETTLRMRYNYARALYIDPAATLDDLSEAVTTLEDARRIARRVLGGPHPLTKGMESELRNARAALDSRETQSPRSN